MTDIEIIKNEKQKIIDQIYVDFESTKEEDRYFTVNNIKDCSSDLDKYIDLLFKSNKSENQQKEISKSIKWIFKSLSTFKCEYEEPEFLWGFIYNGYTKELTDFILQSAFAFGFEKGKSKTIKSTVFHIEHNPRYSDVFRVYIGSTTNNGIILIYNKKAGCFEYDENPYGDSYNLPLFDLKSNEDFSELSFNVLTSGTYRTIILKAQKQIDKTILKAIVRLNENKDFQQPEPDYCSICIDLNKGVMTNLETISYDKDSNIINMFTKGAGMKIFVQELDAEGTFQNSDNLLPHPEIVSEKFIIVDAVPKWKYYEVADLNLKDNIVLITTKNRQFERESQHDNKIVSHEIKSRILKYELKTFEVMKQLLNDLIALREPFISRFES